MKESPFNILFGVHPDLNLDVPLFKDQTSLTKLIISTGFFGRKDDKKTFQSVRVFVNQVVNGKRKPSQKLKQAVYYVLKNNFGFLDEEVDLIYEKIFNALENHKKKSERESDKSDLDQFLDRISKSNTLFVFNPSPAELHQNSDADALKKDILRNTGIVERDKIQSTKKYVFFLPVPYSLTPENVPVKFWENLFSYTSRLIGDSLAEKKLTEVNSSKDWKIKVYSIEKDYCWLPVTVIDPRMPDSEIYDDAEFAFIILFYNHMGKQKVSIAKFSGSVAYSQWRKNVLEKVLPHITRPNSESKIIKEVKFIDVFNSIVKNKKIF